MVKTIADVQRRPGTAALCRAGIGEIITLLASDFHILFGLFGRRYGESRNCGGETGAREPFRSISELQIARHGKLPRVRDNFVSVLLELYRRPHDAPERTLLLRDRSLRIPGPLAQWTGTITLIAPRSEPSLYPSLERPVTSSSPAGSPWQVRQAFVMYSGAR
jgi:hypothetical protein